MRLRTLMTKLKKQIVIIKETALQIGTMADWQQNQEGPGGGNTMLDPETQKKVERPPLYKVLLHNDDFTTMEFVVMILVTVFHRDASAAEAIMLAVHRQGVGVAGVYTYEIAESKIKKVSQMAKANGFPLRCTLEKE